MKTALYLVVIFCALFIEKSQAFACAVCFGGPEDAATQAASSAIIFMLFLLLGVLASFAGFFIYLARRSGRVAEWQEIMEMEEGDSDAPPAQSTR